MSAKEIGDARERLASIMRGEDIGLDGMRLTQIVEDVVKKTAKVEFDGADSRFSNIWRDDITISMGLREKIRDLSRDSFDNSMYPLEIRYNVQAKSKKTGDDRIDESQVRLEIRKAIATQRKSNLKAIQEWVAKEAKLLG